MKQEHCGQFCNPVASILVFVAAVTDLGGDEDFYFVQNL